MALRPPDGQAHFSGSLLSAPYTPFHESDHNFISTIPPNSNQIELSVTSTQFEEDSISTQP
jgi:hypothetical protein